MRLARGLSVAAVTVLAACQQQSQIAQQGDPIPQTRYVIGQPYRINRVWYYPAEDFTYDRTGTASYYGGEVRGIDFHGRRTANGEPYDQNAMTAAHQTLPLPTIVRVTNLANQRSVVVRINDRGPFHSDRIIDLSRRAAQLLGFEGTGTAPVRVQVMADESTRLRDALVARMPPPNIPELRGASQPAPPSALDPPQPQIAVAPSPPAGTYNPPNPASEEPAAVAPPRPAPAPATALYFVQAGAFGSSANAESLGRRLQSFGATRIVRTQVGRGVMYRVRLGPYATSEDANRARSRMASIAPQARVVTE